MAVQWGLANPGGGYDYLETLQALGQQRALDQTLTQRAYGFEQQKAQDAARPAIQQQAASGDYAGATQQAFALGDYDALKYVGGLQAQQHEKLQQEAEVVGRLATSLRQVPQAQRGQAFQAVAPMLQKQGFTPEELQGISLEDGALDQYIALATSTKDAIAAYNKQQEGYTLNQGDRRYVGAEMVAENPAAAKYQAVPEGGMLVRTDGGSATPVLGMGGGGLASGSGGGSSAGRYQYGWTPRARNGGDNSDAAVDSKIAGMSQALGIDPTQPFPPGVTPTQIAQALTLSEGGRGSLADRNNNPGNLRDPRTGDYRKFPTKEAGLAAAAAQVRRNLSRGQNTIQAMVEGVPAGGGRQARSVGAPDVIYGRPKNTASEQYRLLSPQEAQQQGLDPNGRWQASPKGQITALPTKGDKPLTEAQAKAGGYLAAAVEAQNSLNQVSGYKPNLVATALADVSAGNPLRQNLSQTDRRVIAAQLAFATAILRQESGAAISQTEAAQRARILFPEPGDGPEVQADKRKQREAAIRALRFASGPASNNVARIKPNPADRRAPENRGRQQSSNVPSGAADLLRSNPNLRGAFDAKYGAGAAARILGR